MIYSYSVYACILCRHFALILSVYIFVTGEDFTKLYKLCPIPFADVLANKICLN